MNKQNITTYFSFLILCFILANTGLEASWLTGKKRRRTRRRMQATNTQTVENLEKNINTFVDASLTQNSNQQDLSANKITTNEANQQTTIFDEDKSVLSNQLKQSEQKIEIEDKKTAPIEEARIELQFENADLRNLIKQAEAIFDITFIADDIVEPIRKGAKPIKGNKISFKTQRPLTRTEAWNLVLTFLDIAGFAVVPQADPTVYRIEKYEDARQSALPAYIGMDPEELPDNDEMIRYVYFIKNSTVNALQPVIESLRSREAGFVVLQENKAFILTDRAYNIKTLMKIIKELDKVSMPQAMSILKLRRADAKDVEKLYQVLIQQEEGGARPRLFGQRKQSASLYFPDGTQVIAEPRTNSLILLGQKDAIQKIEDFIVKHVDVELDQPYSPLTVYTLKYANAATVADIMNNVTKFESQKPVIQAGGVRGGDKYLKPMSFTAEPATNQIIIQGTHEDYLAAKKILDRLDQPQPQVAIEVLILAVNINDAKQLGTQLRSKVPGPEGFLGQNVKFQTAHLGKIVENTSATVGVNRLLGDLITLATGQNVGSTLLTLGQDMFGVWGVFKMLKTVSNVQIVSNPFLVATNKTPAKVSLGETRRVVTATVAAVNTVQGEGDDSANLTVQVTPQINDDGMIVLQVNLGFDEFVFADQPGNATKTTRAITTQTIVADKEVLALGGLIRNQISDTSSKTPILGDIPILGWFFKNKDKEERKTSLLILISSSIIKPESDQFASRYTQERMANYHGYIKEIDATQPQKDPIHRAFFMEPKESNARLVEDFIFDEQKKRQEALEDMKKNSNKLHVRNRRRGRRRKKKKTVVAQDEPQIITPYIAQPKVIHVAQAAPTKQLLPPPPVFNKETVKTTQPSKNLRSRIKQQSKSKISLEDLLSNNKAELT